MAVNARFDAWSEVPLPGGDMTAGLVRVGNTVRRPHSESSDLVNALLTRLQATGFVGAPRYLGTDDRGRDVLEFLDGDVVSRSCQRVTLATSHVYARGRSFGLGKVGVLRGSALTVALPQRPGEGDASDAAARVATPEKHISRHIHDGFTSVTASL